MAICNRKLFIAGKRAQEKSYSAYQRVQNGIMGHSHDCINILFCFANVFFLERLTVPSIKRPPLEVFLILLRERLNFNEPFIEFQWKLTSATYI